MKVLVIDDSEAVQHSLASLLESVAHVNLVGRAGDAAQAISQIDAHRPDLVVLDIELRHGELSAEVLAHVVQKRPGMQVIVLSNFTNPTVLQGLLAAGAQACFDKANEFMQARDWIATRAAVLASHG